jgi:hypothetical protein
MRVCMAANHVTRFARVDFHSDERVFGIKDEDRLLHMYLSLLQIKSARIGDAIHPGRGD